jgi:serine protease Do
MPFTSRILTATALASLLIGASCCASKPVANRHAAAAAPADIQPAVDAVYPALVRIHVVFEEGEEGRMRKRRASGSGAIISKDGYIITNHHVAGRATRLVCRLSNREEVDAVLIGSDPLCDIAIIKLDLASRRDTNAPLSVATFGDSDKLKVGDVVLAMGSPSGLSQSVTKGIVANTAMIMPNSTDFRLDGENVGELVRWIGHDAVIFHGNSGGPLVNLQGEIVGINEIGIASMGGAIPSRLAQAVAQELIAHGTVSRSWIGLEVQPLLKKMTQRQGVLVSAVLPDSPAKSAGIQPGDFITEYNGAVVQESRSPEDIPLFNRLVLTTPVGTTVTVKGLRDQQPQTWQLTTARREPNQAKEGELKKWGLTVRDFTRVSALESHRTNKCGVLVDSVRPGGPSAESKPALKAEDIILRAGETTIADTAEFARFTKEFTKDLSEPKPVLVTFERGSQELATVVKIGPEVQADKPGRPAKAWLGVQTQVLTSELAEALGLEGRKGVRVTQVVPDSAASRAGAKVGDVFLKLDGRVIAASTPSDEELFDNLIREYKVDSEAELAGVRAGQPLKLTAKLGRQPKPNSDLDEYKDEQFEFNARELSFNDRVSDESLAEVKGVRIVTVPSAGWAALAGLSSGDTLLAIDGQPTDSIATLKKILAQVRDSKPRRVTLFVKRGIRTQFLELEPKW